MHKIVFSEKLFEYKKLVIKQNDIINWMCESEISDLLVDRFAEIIIQCNKFRNFIKKPRYNLITGNKYNKGGGEIDIALVGIENLVFFEVKKRKEKIQNIVRDIPLYYKSLRTNNIYKYFRISDKNVMYIIVTNGIDFWFYPNMKVGKTNDAILKYNIFNATNKDETSLYLLLNTVF
jgi:hypothetical protein